MNAGTELTGNELYPRFTDAEYTRRYQAIREAMERDNLDAILVSGARGSSEVHYLSNYLAQSPCWILFPREGDATVFIHFFNHQPCAKAQSVVEDVRWYGPAPIPTLADEIRRRDLAKSKIGLVIMRSMAYGHVTELQRLFPQVEFVEFGPAFSRIRKVRSEEELCYLRWSGYLTGPLRALAENYAARNPNRKRRHHGVNGQLLGLFDANPPPLRYWARAIPSIPKTFRYSLRLLRKHTEDLQTGNKK